MQDLLWQEIVQMRIELVQMVEEGGSVLDAHVLRQSQRLDQRIVQYLAENGSADNSCKTV